MLERPVFEFVVEFFARSDPGWTADHGMLHLLDEDVFVFDYPIRVVVERFNNNDLQHRAGLGKFHYACNELNVGFVFVLHCGDSIGTFYLNGKSKTLRYY